MVIRDARLEDVGAIVGLLADDALGAGREQIADPLPQAYVDAFARIAASLSTQLMVVERNGQVIGCLQLTLTPGLSRQGATRAQIEAVRVDSALRGRKIGEALVLAAIDRARAAGATLVELTSDKSRRDAHRFYERLGFKASHVGMKLEL